MNDFIEKRFGYLRELSVEERQEKMLELQEDMNYCSELLADENISGEQKTDAGNDYGYDRDMYEFLSAITPAREDNEEKTHKL